MPKNDILIAQNQVLDLLKSRFLRLKKEVPHTISKSFVLLNKVELFTKLIQMEQSSKDFRKLGTYSFEKAVDIYLDNNFCDIQDFQLEMSFERKKRISYMSLFERIKVYIHDSCISIASITTESSDFGIEHQTYTENDKYSDVIDIYQFEELEVWIHKLSSLIKDDRCKIEINLETKYMN